MKSFKTTAILAAVTMCTMLLTGCATTGDMMKRDFRPARQYASGDLMNKGFKYEEANQFVEMCVELDNQDDRMQHPSDLKYVSNVDPTQWREVYDSRKEVARDVVAFKNASEEKMKDSKWAKLYLDIIERADEKPPLSWTETALSKDARYNGFGPYQSAWILYRNVVDTDSYAIAIRGTVFSSRPSVVEDVFFHPVVAEQFLSSSVSFASFSGASVHSGFAHATFSLLLDDKYGVLRILHDQKVKQRSHLFFVGHSQGASMATLSHTFFHYAMARATSSEDPFDLFGMNFMLKSYVFAQPKTGNFVFSADFANITQNFDDAIVINNDIDLVPQVPLTLQDLGDIDGDLPGAPIWATAIRWIAGIGGGFRGTIGRIAEPIQKKTDADYGYFFNYEKIKPVGSDKTASSWNFLPAGHVMLVFGTRGDPSDVFLQHHAWTYRNLIHEQLH